MPRRPNDVDLVRRPEYSKNPPGRPNLPPKPDPLPEEWKPFQIDTDNEHPHGHPQLPASVNASNAMELFQLFFTNELLDELAYYTNSLAKEYYQESKKTNTGYAREWKPTCRWELYAYLGGLLYMALHREPSIGDYWKISDGFLPAHPVSNYISRNRFEQIDRFLYCTEPGQRFQSAFGRVIHLSDYIKTRAQKYYKPGPNLAVDEMIQGFNGRASEIVNIPHKPTPKGFKIWVLACYGYILNWMFHAKGKDRGPVELDPIWVEYGFTPTESVPLTLGLHRDPDSGERMLKANKHILWFDNLFTTIPLLETLRELGIGAAGTVRTMRTKREEQWDAEEEAAIFLHGNKVEAIEDPAQESLQQSTSTVVVEAYNSQSTSTGFSQSESLSLSLQRQRKNQHAAGLLPPREKFSERLMSIKSTFNNRVV